MSSTFCPPAPASSASCASASRATTPASGLRLAVLGRGRLGGRIAQAAAEAAGIELACVIDSRSDIPAPQAAPDVAIDVSTAAAVPGHLRWAIETGTDLVIGTTGWDHDLLQQHRDAIADSGIGVMVAPNFSLSLALMRRLASVVAAFGSHQGDLDLAVVDTHHRGKADAPSGTARTLAAALATGAGTGPEAVQTLSLRLGQAAGRHEVIVQTAGESLGLVHQVDDPQIYATGALAAARWISTHPGIHSFDELAADLIEPLLTSGARTAPAASDAAPDAATHAALEQRVEGSPIPTTPRTPLAGVKP